MKETDIEDLSAIETAIKNAVENKKVYSGINAFVDDLNMIYKVKTNDNEFKRFKTYEAINNRFNELYKMDVSDYLAAHGIINSKQEEIETFKKSYDPKSAYKDLITFLKKNGKRIKSIEADDCVLPSSYTIDYILDRKNDTLRLRGSLVFVKQYIKKKDLIKIKKGQKVKLVRDPFYPDYKDTIRIETEDGKPLGLLHWQVCKVLSPLLDLSMVSVENGEIIGMDLSNSYSPVVAVDFDIKKVGDDPSDSEIKDTASWYKMKKISLPSIDEYKSFKTELHYQGGYLIVDSTFTNAIFRGFKKQIDEAEDFITAECGHNCSINETITPDIYELHVINSTENDKSLDVIGKTLKKFPALKMVSFYNYDLWRGYVVLSAPGYGHVTNAIYISETDPKSEINYTWDYEPTDSFYERINFVQTGIRADVKYKFPFEKEWNRFDYLFNDGDAFYAISEVQLPKSIIELNENAYQDSQYLEKVTYSPLTHIIKKE